MAYSSRYFTDNYFPSYFQTAQRTEVLTRWAACGWYTAGWISGEPCPVTPVVPVINASGVRGGYARVRRETAQMQRTKNNNLILMALAIELT